MLAGTSSRLVFADAAAVATALGVPVAISRETFVLALGPGQTLMQSLCRNAAGRLPVGQCQLGPHVLIAELLADQQCACLPDWWLADAPGALHAQSAGHILTYVWMFENYKLLGLSDHGQTTEVWLPTRILH